MISVQTYGAVGNGIADDTVAIRNAIAAVGSTGGMVSFPAGTYRISDTLHISSPNITLVGEGTEATFIETTNTAADIISVYASPFFAGGGVRDMSLRVSGTATLGAAIRVNDQRNIRIQDVWIHEPFQGIVLEADNRTCRIENVDISNHLDVGFLINGGGNPYLHTCTTFGGRIAFLVTQAEGAWFTNCVSQSASYGLRVAPDPDKIVLDLWINGCDFDNSTFEGVTFDSGTAGGRITTVNWNGSRIGFGNSHGMVMNGNQNQHFQFSNLLCEKNAGHGLVIGNAKNVHFSNAVFLGNNSLNNSVDLYGIDIHGGDGVTFTGGQSGRYLQDGNNQKYGIVFHSTFTGKALVSAVDLRGNKSGGILNGAGANVLFRDCLI